MAGKKKVKKSGSKKKGNGKAKAKTNGKPRQSKVHLAQLMFGLDTDNPKCLCGCGQKVSRLFKQGHDMLAFHLVIQ